MTDLSPFTIATSGYGWRAVTHLGAAGLLLPVFAAQMVGLWSWQRALATRWALAVAMAASVALLTKCLFFGSGLGIAALNFTGISGHALLATSIYPVLFSIHAPQNSPRWQRAGLYLGLAVAVAVAVAVGVSRIVLGAHSASEVWSAWGLGLLVSYIVPDRKPRLPNERWPFSFTKISPISSIPVFLRAQTPKGGLCRQIFALRFSMFLMQKE